MIKNKKISIYAALRHTKPPRRTVPFGGFVCFARREKRRGKLKKVKRIGLIDYSFLLFTAKLLHVDNVNASLRLA